MLPNFLNRAIKVAAGAEHSIVLTKDGEIYASGNNSEGNLGLGHKYSSDSFLNILGTHNITFVHISAGRHSAAITDDNRLYVWGPVFQGEDPMLLP